MKDIESYNALTFIVEKTDSFEVKDNIVTCKSCKYKHIYKPKEGITPLKRHLNTKKHLKSIGEYKPAIKTTRLNLDFILNSRPMEQ